MGTVGQIECASQNQLVKLSQNGLEHTYLGNLEEHLNLTEQVRIAALLYIWICKFC